MTVPETASTTDVSTIWNAYLRADRPHGSPLEERLTQHYVPFVVRACERFSQGIGSMLERDEVLQVGYIATLEAMRTFDPERAAFETYLVRRIEWKIRDTLRNNDHLPRARRAAVKALNETVATLSANGVDSPTMAELLTHTGLTRSALQQAMDDAYTQHVESLSGLAGDSGSDDDANYRVAEDRTTSTLEEEVLHKALASSAVAAIGDLAPRDRQMVALYYFGGHTLEEVGRVFSLHHSRVSQRLKASVKILRKSIDEDLLTA